MGEKGRGVGEGGRSEGGIGKQERRKDGEQEGKKKRKEVGRQEGGGEGRAEERDGGESEREGEQYTCTPASWNAVLLTNVVVASPPSPTMSPPSLDCCVVWRWEINE